MLVPLFLKVHDPDGHYHLSDQFIHHLENNSRWPLH